ncbi:MAG TPA: hypothetical protein VMS17_25500, partial [Gemmataceae bacterium]|nr:hypothetical protein [Gemmataceae bacterium]
MKQIGSTSNPSSEAAPLERLGAGIDFTDPHSPLAPLYLRTSGVVACAVLSVVFVIASIVPLWQSDVWGH